MTEQLPNLMSTGQAAKAVGVSAATILRACEAGTIACFFTPGGHRRITLTEVRKYIAHRTGAYRDYV